MTSGSRSSRGGRALDGSITATVAFPSADLAFAVIVGPVGFVARSPPSCLASADQGHGDVAIGEIIDMPREQLGHEL